MRLLELELENWGRHSKLKVDLSGGLQISGRNGTGKSSILEAVRFIFSESGSGYKSRIRKGADHARVKLRFQRGADVYSVEKRLFPKKASAANMWINRNPVADNPGSVYRRMQEVLSEDVLDKLMYVPQGTLTDLISRLRLKGGRQELDRLFGLDRLEEVYRGIGEEIRLKEVEGELIGRSLARYPPDAEAVFEKEVSGILSQRKSLEKKLEECGREQKILDSKIEQLERKIEEMRSVKKRKDELLEKQNELRVKSAGIGKEVEGLRESLRLLSEKKAEADVLLAASGGLKKYPAVREFLVELADDESKLAGLGDLAQKKKVYEEVEAELSSRYTLEIEYEAATEKASKLRTDVGVRRQHLLERRGYLRDLASLSGKAKCPRCNQALTSQHVAEEKKAAEEEIHKLEKDIKEMSAELLSFQVKSDSAKKKLDELMKKDAENRQRKLEIERGAKEKEALREDVKKIKEALSEAGYSGESLKQSEDRVKELQEIEARISVFSSEIKKEARYVKEAAAKEELLKELLAEEKSLAAESGKLKYDEAVLEDLRRRREGFISQKTTMLLEARDAKSRISEGEIFEAEVLAKKKELSDLKKKEKDLSSEIGLIREAREIFHTDKGVAKYLREKYVKQLSVLLTQHFRRINQNPRYRDITFDKDYELEIRTAEGGFTVDQLSGGEKVQIAIALRIALLELLSPMRLLMLDEPFGSLDRDHRDVLGEALNRIAGEGQLIIVTHIPVDSLQLPELDLGGY